MGTYFFQLCSKNRHVYLSILLVLAILGSSFLLNACKFQDKGKEQTLYFEGHANKTVMLYKIQKDNKNMLKYSPVRTLTTQFKYSMPPGTYLIANDCTSYVFTLNPNEQKHIRLNTFQIKFFENQDYQVPLINAEDTHNVDVQCTNVVINKKNSFSNKTEFDILPGKNQIKLAGINILFESGENEEKNFFIELSSLKLISPLEKDTTQFFLRPTMQNLDDTSQLNAGEVNRSFWLVPGKYDLEINGTTSSVQIDAKQNKNILLGSIRIVPPKNFLSDDRSNSSARSFFAYINKKVLFIFEKNYALFPGRYSINLENSDMEQEIEVIENSFLKIQTYGAQINPPPCPEAESKKCNFSQKVFLHLKDQPYVFAKVPLGVPFLVLQGEYQYSIEGVDGILKNLIISAYYIQTEHVGKLKIKWKLQVSSNNLETRKIFIAAECCGVFGKSEDLNFYKPRELVLPVGNYNLSYFVRQEKGPLQRTMLPVHVLFQQVNEVQVPIYASGNQNMQLFLQDENETENITEPSNLIPIVQ